MLISTCNRFEHFRNLVTSLQACPEAKKTHLYVALDAPYSPSVIASNRRIASLADRLKGFGAVTVWKRDQNLGPNRNIGQAVEDVFRSHDRLIFLEDDNVVARNFLAFMNQTMEAFAPDPRCFAVGGHHWLPTDPTAPRADFYRAPYFGAWGIGLFRDRFIPAHLLSGQRPDSFFAHPLGLWKSLRHVPHLFRIYMEGWLQGKRHGDALYSLRCLKKNHFVVYPAVTKVMNRGFDGSGQHCGVSDRVLHQGFVRENQFRFDLTPSSLADAFFCRKNRKWFAQEFAVPVRHTLSLYWRYLTRVAGIRPSPPPEDVRTRGRWRNSEAGKK